MMRKPQRGSEQISIYVWPIQKLENKVIKVVKAYENIVNGLQFVVLMYFKF